MKLLAGVRDDVEVLLEHHGVVRFGVLGHRFDPRRQTAVEKVADPDPDRAGDVARRVRPGFEQGQDLIVKERVAVFYHDASLALPDAVESERAGDPGD